MGPGASQSLPIVLLLFSYYLLARRQNAPAACFINAPFRRRVWLIPAVKNFLPPHQKMRQDALSSPSRRVPFIHVSVSDGGRVLVGGRFSLSCRRKFFSGPRCWREVHCGPCCFDFVFLDDLLKLKFLSFQLCPSIKTDYIRKFYFSPYTFDF